MKYGFFIGCYIPSDNFGIDMVSSCVSSVRAHHPDSPIYVIDSDSNYLDINEYITEVEHCGGAVDFAKNKNYSTGMIWHVFRNYPHFDYYFFLHDSHEVKENLEECLDFDVATISYFNSHNGLAREHPGREYGFSPNGTYPRESLDWCEKMLRENTPYRLPDIFTGVGYSVFFCKRHVLEKLNSNGVSKILPNNKTQDQSMERVWGIALESEGFDLKKKTFKYNKKVRKKFRGRK